MTVVEQGEAAPAGRRNPIVETALTIGAICGVICIVAALSAVFFGITPLIFRSGSMAPSIVTGSLALGRNVSGTDLKVGDIVSVDRSDGSRVTHRIVEIDSIVGNSATIVLKGDANADPDAEPYVVADATRVVAHIPYAGYLVAWLGTPFAWVTGVLCAAALIYVAFRPAATSRHRGKHTRGGKRETRTAVASIALVLTVATVVGTGFSRSAVTAAALTDSAYGNAAVTAATMTRPTSFTCTTTGALLTTATLTWVASNPLYGHRLVFTPPVGAPVTQDYAVGVTTATPPAAILNVLTTWTVTLYSKGGDNFLSATGLSRTILSTSVFGIGLVSSCVTGGTATSLTTRSARVADPSTITPTTTPTTTSVTQATTETTTTATPTTTIATSSTTTAPSSTTTPPPTTTTTPPPPPASAFVSDGSSASSGGNTASVSDGQLTVTDGTTTLYTRSITTTERYGTGVVWGSDGSLYLLSGGAPVRITPADDGTFTATTVSVDTLPPDIAALL